MKARTKVSDVHRYQNDGTEKITPSRYVERAEEASDEWSDELGNAMDHFIGNNESALQDAADTMAKDISDMCDRVKTGRLKSSFTGVVKHGRD